MLSFVRSIKQGDNHEYKHGQHPKSLEEIQGDTF